MKNFPLKPLHDRVIVLPDSKEKVTKGGMIIPDTAQEKPSRGVVMASGAGLKDLPNEVKPGDIVLYGKFAGSEIEHDDTAYLIIRESDILVIETPDKPKKKTTSA